MKKRPSPEEKISFPHTITERGVSVKIYRGDNNGHSSFFVTWQDAGGRQRKRCSTWERAKTEAAIAINARVRGHVEVLNLTNDDRLTYVRSLAHLEPLGIRLDEACHEYAEAKRRLGDASLIDAVKFYAEQRPDSLPKKTVTEVVAELLHARERDGRSAVYVKALRTTLKRFEAAFPKLVTEVRRADIEEHLRSDYAKLSARSRNNAAGYIRTLFSFAQDQGYIYQHRRTEATKLARAKEATQDIEVFKPAEMVKLLARVAHVPDASLYVALGGFAGLRTAEIKRLTWDHIDLYGGFVKMTAGITKTMARRVVPISDNLKAFLLAQGGDRAGNVVRFVRPEKTTAELLQKDITRVDGTTEEGIEWRHNALRHSFISYRLATVKNLNQVALEAGNSPGIIQRHYYETVSEAEAKEWFAIMPKA
jgi:integrase